MNDLNMEMNKFAFAKIIGSNKYPNIYGKVYFKELNNGVLVTAEINGLPYGGENGGEDIYGFHVHEGESCIGDEKDPFLNAKSHYNKTNFLHPYHSGDMPPLFGNKGYAYLSFFTDRFNIEDIVGKVVIIHRMPDDLKTNPSGNSGEKIACGKIFAV